MIAKAARRDLQSIADFYALERRELAAMLVEAAGRVQLGSEYNWGQSVQLGLERAIGVRVKMF